MTATTERHEDPERNLDAANLVVREGHRRAPNLEEPAEQRPDGSEEPDPERRQPGSHLHRLTRVRAAPERLARTADEDRRKADQQEHGDHADVADPLEAPDLEVPVDRLRPSRGDRGCPMASSSRKRRASGFGASTVNRCASGTRDRCSCAAMSFAATVDPLRRADPHDEATGPPEIVVDDGDVGVRLFELVQGAVQDRDDLGGAVRVEPRLVCEVFVDAPQVHLDLGVDRAKLEGAIRSIAVQAVDGLPRQDRLVAEAYRPPTTVHARVAPRRQGPVQDSVGQPTVCSRVHVIPPLGCH